jgi:hypothetical protein
LPVRVVLFDAVPDVPVSLLVVPEVPPEVPPAEVPPPMLVLPVVPLAEVLPEVSLPDVLPELPLAPGVTLSEVDELLLPGVVLLSLGDEVEADVLGVVDAVEEGDVVVLELLLVPFAPLPARSQPVTVAVASARTATTGMIFFMTSPIRLGGKFLGWGTSGITTHKLCHTGRL